MQTPQQLDRENPHHRTHADFVHSFSDGLKYRTINSIYQIEQAIDEKGGKDKEELHELLNEVKELIENIEASRSIPKQKKLYQRISDHMEKHGWFYGAVVQLLGTAALDLLGG